MRFDMHNLKVIPYPLYDIYFALYLIVSMLSDPSPPTGLFVCLFVNKISQKVMDGSGRNLLESLGVLFTEAFCHDNVHNRTRSRSFHYWNKTI